MSDQKLWPYQTLPMKNKMKNRTIFTTGAWKWTELTGWWPKSISIQLNLTAAWRCRPPSSNRCMVKDSSTVRVDRGNSKTHAQVTAQSHPSSWQRKKRRKSPKNHTRALSLMYQRIRCGSLWWDSWGISMWGWSTIIWYSMKTNLYLCPLRNISLTTANM